MEALVSLMPSENLEVSITNVSEDPEKIPYRVTVPHALHDGIPRVSLHVISENVEELGRLIDYWPKKSASLYHTTASTHGMA